MRIGILGAGQLARMLILSGNPLGFEFIVYTPQPTASTQGLAETVLGDYTDIQMLNKFIIKTDVITYENENIPIEAMAHLEKNKPVYPSSSALACIQDRLFEKNIFKHLQIPTPKSCAINTKEDFQNATKKIGTPLILKSRRGGYDGKNQIIIKSKREEEKIKLKNLNNYIAEELICFDREISIIGARSINNETAFYDICENNHRDGILRLTKNKPNDPFFNKAKECFLKIINHFNYVGVLTLEFFVKGQALLANEVAPRVHNSGHWTIEGAHTSQFENHLRAVSGLPLGSTLSIGYSTMMNCIGTMPIDTDILKTPGTYCHDYLKCERPDRKMGHITYITETEKERQKRNASLTF